MNLVIFDFCETLVKFQTADTFVDYIIKKEKYYKFKWVAVLSKIATKLRILAVLNKLFPELNPSKRLKLFQIRGIGQDKINSYAKEFYEDELLINLIQPLYELMLKHIKQDDYVLIISGGYSPYIKVFSEYHNIKDYFATEMELDNQKLTGFFQGKDCLYGQKVVLLEQYLNKNQINFSKSIAYSDSISDLPLLLWANEGFVISKQHSQSWALKNNLKEIIHS